MNIEIPLVFDIAKGSFVDGPGIRTVVFLKGCPLRCRWCQNPESQSPNAETFYFPEECIDCGNCRERKRCFTGAKRVVGKYYSPLELTELILQDRTYYEVSDGGVTFSGGEPGIFVDYLPEILVGLKQANINIAIQTSGYFDFNLFESKLLPYIDIIYYDIKLIDPVKHTEYTGVSNELIIDNFVELVSRDVELVPRIPLVPEYTATEDNLTNIAHFLREHDINKCELLSYNPSGIEKWKRMGKAVPEGVPDVPFSIQEERYWHDVFTTLSH